jgi:HEAT repeat protein
VTLPETPNIPHLISELGNPDQKQQTAARNALEIMGLPAVEPLIAALQNPDEKVRTQAILALRYIQDARAVPAFLKTIQNDPVQDVKQQALSSLYRFVDVPGVMDTAIRLAKEGSFPAQRQTAVNLVANHKTMDAEFWLEMLNDSEPMVVIISIRALVKSNDPRSVDALRHTLGKWSGNDGVIYNIFNSWMALDKKLTFEDVAPYLKSSDDITRGRAAWILGKIGDPRAIDVLQTLLEDKAKAFQPEDYAPYETVSSLAKASIKQIQSAHPN